MFGVNGWEVVLLALIAVFVLGPDKLPEYAAKLARGIRKARIMAEGAKDQLKEQLGPEYEDINWRQYDPRQYDPRRIVREALLEPLDEAVAPVRDEIGSVRSAAGLASDTVAPDAQPATDPDVVRPSRIGATAAAAVAGSATVGAAATGRPGPQEYDPSRPTPFDDDAT
ncbi:MAG TPA: Sec-independent protein translocase subunit TatB [Phycicoccus sp.]